MILPLEELRKHRWSVSWSGGKDSTATIILMHRYGVPIESIDYVQMIYDDEIVATLPEMTSFVESAADTFRGWGYPVNIVPCCKSAVDIMNNYYRRSNIEGLNGNKYGVSAFRRSMCGLQKWKVYTLLHMIENTITDYRMVGYAIDEPERFVRLNNTKQSILVTLNITEKEAFRLCRSYGLLSPLYDMGLSRDGCFFCPNASRACRSYIYANHPTLAHIIYNDISNSCTRSFMVSRNLNNWVQDYELFSGDVPSFLPQRFFEGEDSEQITFFY